jgi:hypothetical protein
LLHEVILGGVLALGHVIVVVSAERDQTPGLISNLRWLLLWRNLRKWLMGRATEDGWLGDGRLGNSLRRCHVWVETCL